MKLTYSISGIELTSGNYVWVGFAWDHLKGDPIHTAVYTDLKSSYVEARNELQTRVSNRWDDARLYYFDGERRYSLQGVQS